MADSLKPHDAIEVESAIRAGARRGKDARSRRPRHQARHRPRRAMGRDARPFGRCPASRSMSRRNSCSRPRPERRSPKSKRWWRQASRNSPSSRWIMRALLGGAARRRHHRRRDCGQPVRAAPHQGRRRARSFSRLHRGVRPRRDVQVRRPRGQERHRLRPVQAHRRLLGHARGDDRRDHQDAAQGRDRGDGPGARASTT